MYFLNAVNIEDHQYVFLGASKFQIRNTHIDPTLVPRASHETIIPHRLHGNAPSRHRRHSDDTQYA